MHIEGAFITVSDCLVYFMYSVSCDYVSTQEFGSIVSNTIDTERTQVYTNLSYCCKELMLCLRLPLFLCFSSLFYLSDYIQCNAPPTLSC